MSRSTMQVEELLRELNLPSIKAVDEYGNTALHLTVKNKTFSQKTIVEVLEILLYIGINPNTKNKKNQTVSHLAVTYRMKDVINFLISHKINMDFIPHFFIEDEYITIQDFLSQMNNLDEWHEGILRMQTERVAFVEWLIFKGFDFDCKNQENKSALKMAIQYNLQDILPVLLKYTKDVNFLDIEATDNYGNTALHLTVTNKLFTQKKIVEDIEVLIGRGINPDSKNNNNQTALHLAVAYRMKDVIDCLMAHNVNLDFVAYFFVEIEYATFQEFLKQIDNLDEWYGEILRMETESIDFVEWLVSKGIDFDCKNQENGSALLMAIEHNLQHILPVLLKCTKDIKFIDKDNKTLLHLFLQTNFTSTCYSAKSINKKWYTERYTADIVRILLGRLTADAEDKFKLTPIQIAIANEEDICVIQILMERCSKIHDRHIHDETIFQAVIRYCLSASTSRSEYYLKILSSLIARGANVNELYEFDKYGYTVICYAIAYRNMWLINFLEKNGADFSVTTKDGRNLLHLLATSTATMENGDDSEVNVIPHEFVFFWDEAIEHTQHLTVVQTLIEHGVEVDRIRKRPYESDTSALYVAAVKKGDLGLMISLEKNGINFRTTPKHEIVVPALSSYEPTKSIHVLELSEENEEDFRFIVKSHENLLRRSSKSSYMETDNDTNIKLVDLLISKGCQLNGKDIIGNTPLHVAAEHAGDEVVRMLIENGANVNSRNKRRETPLHCAVKNRRRRTEVSKLLLEHDANVNAKDSRGRTALHKIAMEFESGYYEMLQMLLEYGADVTALDAKGLSALSCALLREHEIRIDNVYRYYFHELLKMDDTVRHEFVVLAFSDDEGWHFVKKDTSELYVFKKIVYLDTYDVKISFVTHSLKLEAANVPWDPILGNYLSGLYDLEDTDFYEMYYDDCLSKVEALKNIFIDDHTSLYTLLNMNPNRRCAYAQNKMLRELVHESRYPLNKYFVLVSACYREAVKRKSLLELTKETWLELTKIYLPVELLEFIFSYFSNDDLFIFIEKD